MKVFGIPVTELVGEVSAGPLIPACEMSRLFSEHHQLHGARLQAAIILRNARKKQREIIFHSRQQAALEQEREMIELRALLQQDTLLEIQEAIKWLVDEQQFERSISHSLYVKAVNWAVDVLKAWGANLEWEKMVATKITEFTRLQLSPENLMLSIHPDSVERLRAELPEALQIQFEADPELAPGHAILENNLLKIDIDLQKQFDLLISQLARLTVPAGSGNGF